MTATGGVYFYENEQKRPITLEERLRLSCLEGYNLNAFYDNCKALPMADKIRMLGNMVQIPFAHILLEHIRINILKR